MRSDAPRHTCGTHVWRGAVAQRGRCMWGEASRRWLRPGEETAGRRAEERRGRRPLRPSRGLARLSFEQLMRGCLPGGAVGGGGGPKRKRTWLRSRPVSVGARPSAPRPPGAGAAARRSSRGAAAPVVRGREASEGVWMRGAAMGGGGGCAPRRRRGRRRSHVSVAFARASRLSAGAPASRSRATAAARPARRRAA